MSRASASRWSQQKRWVGHVAPKPLGGDQRSRHIEAHAEVIRQIYEVRPQIFLRELRETLRAHGVEVSTSTLSRFFAGTRSRVREGAASIGAGARDVGAALEAWFEGQDELHPERLVFLDETAATTSMVRRYGWAERGSRRRPGARKPPP